jgi:predicted Zn-dependent peptidase
MERETLEQAARAERAGIPVWWADVPGPFMAAMCFRVGRADELLSTAGATHLVEHLALFALGRREHAFNGFVDDTRCVFYAEGERAEVLEFLRLVAEALACLPVDRLELERRVLRAEAARREYDVIARLLDHRYGAGGYGLCNYLELGLRWLKAVDVRDWCDRHYTRGNVALWMTGEPPDDFDLALHDGPRVAAPAPEPLPLRVPCFVAEGTGGVALSGTGARSVALNVASSVAAERLYERVRRERGLAYAPYGDYRPLDGATAHVAIGTDCDDEHADVVLGELRRALRELAEDGATAEELERRARASARRTGEPDVLRALLDAAADAELMGLPQLNEAQLLAELEALDAGAVAAAVRDVLEDALVLGPTGSTAPDAKLSPAELDQPEPVEGETFVPVKRGWRRRRSPQELRVGERGVSWRDEDGDPVTIEWDDLAAVEEHLDGQLRMYSRLGSWLELSPHGWDEGTRAFARIRERIPARLLVPPTDWALTEAIERAVERRITDRDVVGLPLRALPDELSEQEGVVDMAVAVKGRRAGLLVVTERRVLWLSSVDDERLEAARGANADSRGAELELSWDGGSAKLQILPRELAPVLRDAIRERRER